MLTYLKHVKMLLSVVFLTLAMLLVVGISMLLLALFVATLVLKLFGLAAGAFLLCILWFAGIMTFTDGIDH
jgi:hypothetical protein